MKRMTVGFDLVRRSRRIAKNCLKRYENTIETAIDLEAEEANVETVEGVVFLGSSTGRKNAKKRVVYSETDLEEDEEPKKRKNKKGGSKRSLKAGKKDEVKQERSARISTYSENKVHQIQQNMTASEHLVDRKVEMKLKDVNDMLDLVLEQKKLAETLIKELLKEQTEKHKVHAIVRRYQKIFKECTEVDEDIVGEIDAGKQDNRCVTKNLGAGTKKMEAEDRIYSLFLESNKRVQWMIESGNDEDSSSEGTKSGEGEGANKDAENVGGNVTGDFTIHRGTDKEYDANMDLGLPSFSLGLTQEFEEGTVKQGNIKDKNGSEGQKPKDATMDLGMPSFSLGLTQECGDDTSGKKGSKISDVNVNAADNEKRGTEALRLKATGKGESPSFSLGLTQEFGAPNWDQPPDCLTNVGDSTNEKTGGEVDKKCNTGKETAEDMKATVWDETPCKKYDLHLEKQMSGSHKEVDATSMLLWSGVEASLGWEEKQKCHTSDEQGGWITDDYTAEEDAIWAFIFEQPKHVEGYEMNRNGEKIRFNTRCEVLEARPAIVKMGDVFDTACGFTADWKVIRSLENNTELYREVVDCWAAVLNEEERQKTNTVKRLLCGPVVFKDWMFTVKGYDDDMRLHCFGDAMFQFIGGFEKFRDLQAFDMVLLTVLEKQQFYIIAFDLKNPGIYLIDNMKEDKSIVKVEDNEEYFKKSTPYKVKHIFCTYLDKYKNRQAELIRGQIIRRLEVGWATKGNVADCGVFTMRHMEMFKGSTYKNFNCGFGRSESRKIKQIGVLRKKYATRMLLCNANKKRLDVMKAAGLEV